MPCCWKCVRWLFHGARDTRKTEPRFVKETVVVAGSRPERSEVHRVPVPKNESRQETPQSPLKKIERREENSEHEVETETIGEDEEEELEEEIQEEYSYGSLEQEDALELTDPRSQVILQSDLVFSESPARSPVRGIRVSSLQPVYHPDFADWRDCLSPADSHPPAPRPDLMSTLEVATTSVAVFFSSSFRRAPPP
jgi:hypothetical protein